MAITARRLFAAGMLSAAAVATALQWHFRYHVNPDAVSYLDIAVNVTAGEWRRTVNAVFSPLYPFLLSPAVRYFEADRFHAVFAAHLIGVVLVLFVVGASWNLWRAATESGSNDTADGFALLVLGAGLAAAMTVVPPSYLTPDVLVAGLVIWIVARLVEDVRRDPAIGRCVATGLVAGVAYLAKTYAAYFSAIVIVLSFVIAGRLQPVRRAAAQAAAYAAGFMAIAALWIVVLTVHTGHLTVGDAGRAGFLDREPPNAAASMPPHVKAFELPFPVSMPEHYEPVAPVTTAFTPRLAFLHVVNLGRNTLTTFFGHYPPDLPLFWPFVALLAVAVPALLLSTRPRSAPLTREAAFLLASALVGFFMFVSVHVESRYLAPFLVMLAAYAAAQRTALSAESRRALSAVAATVGLCLWMFPLVFWMNTWRSSQGDSRFRSDVTGLVAWMGNHGRRYAVAGATYDAGAEAWLSHSTLVASVLGDQPTPADCERIDRELAALRVDAVLTRSPLDACGPTHAVRDTGWFYRVPGDRGTASGF